MCPNATLLDFDFFVIFLLYKALGERVGGSPLFFAERGVGPP
jgi:hypothetical protein